MTEIDRLKEGGDKSVVSEETKDIVETITGLNYEVLWSTNQEVV